MSRHYRVLRNDFRQHLSLADAWPKPIALRHWLRETWHEGLGNRVLGHLADGRPLSDRHVIRFVHFLRQPRDPSSDPRQHREALLAYLSRRDLKEPSDLDALVAMVSEPAPASLLDAFWEGMGLVHSVLERFRNPSKCVQQCTCEQDVREAVRWMFTEVGRLMSRKSMNVADSIQRGEDRHELDRLPGLCGCLVALQSVERDMGMGPPKNCRNEYRAPADR